MSNNGSYHGELLFIRTQDWVLRSRDNGTTWEELPTPPANFRDHSWCFQYAPTTDQLFIGYSVDGGSALDLYAVNNASLATTEEWAYVDLPTPDNVSAYSEGAYQAIVLETL